MSRFKLDRHSQIALLNEIIKPVGFATVAAKLDVSRSALKKWVYGNRAWPEEKFEQLLLCFPRARYFAEGTRLSDTWGQSLGGRKYTSGLPRKTLLSRMASVRRAQKKATPFVIPAKIEESQVLEFFGIMLGDGCISEYTARYDARTRRETRITLNSEKDRIYAEKFILPLIARNFLVKIRLSKRKSSNTIDLSCVDPRLFYWLKKNGFPVGEKTNLRLPKKIMNLTPTLLSSLVRGLFDTDGCISARKDEKYRYPYIMITSKSEVLREQVKKILLRLGFNAYIHAITVTVRGKQNCFNWFEKIGSNNPRNKDRFTRWAETGVLKTGS